MTMLKTRIFGFEGLEADCLDALVDLINSAYRGVGGAGRWTTENHLVAGDRIDRDGLLATIQDVETTFIVGYCCDNISACVAIKRYGGLAEFGTFAVDPELHGKGLGSELLCSAELMAPVEIKVFQVSVVSRNADLIAFYRRRGYRETGERIDYPSDLNVGTPRVDGLDLILLQKNRASPKT